MNFTIFTDLIIKIVSDCNLENFAMFMPIFCI